MIARIWKIIRESTRRYFGAGLLVFAPIGITIWAMAWIIQRLDNLLLPYVLRLVFPDVDSPPSVPFLGALFTFLVILLVGVVARHFFGNELVRGWERLLSRVPVARSIYGGVKQLFEAILHSNARSSFNRVVLVEYPRRGVYAIAFTTGTARGAAQRAVPESRLVNCFVPTTPNPTSGFYLLIPAEDIREIDLSVEDAFKVIMSAGIVSPNELEPAAQPASVSTQSLAAPDTGSAD